MEIISTKRILNDVFPKKKKNKSGWIIVIIFFVIFVIKAKNFTREELMYGMAISLLFGSIILLFFLLIIVLPDYLRSRKIKKKIYSKKFYIQYSTIKKVKKINLGNDEGNLNAYSVWQTIFHNCEDYIEFPSKCNIHEGDAYYLVFLQDGKVNKDKYHIVKTIRTNPHFLVAYEADKYEIEYLDKEKTVWNKNILEGKYIN